LKRKPRWIFEKKKKNLNKGRITKEGGEVKD